MPRATAPSSTPAGPMYGRVIAFLLGSTTLLLFVCYRFLRPALEAKKAAMGTTRPTASELQNLRALSALSSLLLAILLVVLLAGLVLTFRIGRFFRPRPLPPRVVTQHVDVWTEAGKRLQADELDESGESEESDPT